MPRHLDTETLRAWLENNRPVTVVDVRNEEDRAQWVIPGSVHIDAYEALKAGKTSALAYATLPVDRPIVTVCNLGKMSEKAADELSARGLNALSLAGGMKAWSLAWNSAEVNLSPARVIQVRRTGKGCLSYIVSSGKDAVVIDASLPPDVYCSIAEQQDVRIRYVLDTHIHADHLSRSRQLAGVTGGELLLPVQDRARFPHRQIEAGDIIRIGSSSGLQVLATPGHTMESTSYLLDGEALFSGDTLFTMSVGRPDLHADRNEARLRASVLFQSVQQLLALGPAVLVFPGHSSTPPAFDGIPVAQPLGRIAEHLGEWLVSEPAFVDRILARIPPAPPNYERIIQLNEAGLFPAGDVTDLEAGANRCAIG